MVLLKMLKRAGGNPDITSALGLTPLSYCCTFKLSVDPKGGGPLENMQVFRPHSRDAIVRGSIHSCMLQACYGDRCSRHTYFKV